MTQQPDQDDEHLSMQEFLSKLAAVSADIQQIKDKMAQSDSPRGFAQFFSSGIFFILLGMTLLTSAYIGLAIGVHTSFSFVLVVLGVAILLFGTGTQGVGRLEQDATTARYNVAIAGGAGVLAIAIGFGMIQFGPQMQRAFGVETRYVIATLRPNPDGSSTFAEYWAEFEIDGTPIPSVRRGEVIHAFVPYLDTQKDLVKRVSYRLRPQDPRVFNASFRASIVDKFEVPLAAVNRHNSGTDFPTYDNIAPIDTRSTASASIVLKAAADRSLPLAVGAAVPNPSAPATLEVQ